MLDPQKVDLALKMYDSKACSVAEITKVTGVSKSALYAYLQRREGRSCQSNAGKGSGSH